MFSEVKVSEARERRDQARELLVAGVDPGELRKQERAAQLEHRVRRPAALHDR
ncbi:hypothetical protein [Burkholderia sp. Bp9142]|uniref:hypothetical protein n=1 Tax=Burkholderia sp. Bp9142 TaxID=2184573 RepID=UPI0028931C3F|nr:hypothetical protein [Burkholderia sp. Bp9142]